MTNIELLQVPNQSFKFQANGELYDITIRNTNKAAFISINRDNEILISNQILIPNTTIIRYAPLVTNGNFILTTKDNNLPDYTKFEQTQFFYYTEVNEL